MMTKKGTLMRFLYGSLLLMATLAPVQAQKVLSLDSCRALALHNNHTIEITKHKVIQAEAKHREVLSHAFPKVSALGAWIDMERSAKLVDWKYLLGDYSMLLPSGLTDLTTLQVNNTWMGSVTAVQPLFMGGQILSGIKMAKRAVNLAQTMGEIKRTEVIEHVEQTYWQVVLLSSKERLLIQLIDLLNSAVKDVDTAIEVGVATKADGLAIRVKRNEAEQKLLEVQNGLHLSRLLLAQECGLALGEEIEPNGDDLIKWDEPFPLTPKKTPNISIDSRIELRPEIRSLRLADSIYNAKKMYETGNMLPKLLLIGGYTTSNPNIYSAPRDQFGGSWAISVVLQVPITDLYSGYQKRRQAEAEQMIKRCELADAQEKISLQMQQSIMNNEASIKQVKNARLNCQRAQENLRYAQVGYKEGVIPLLNLTQAQTAWMQANDSYTEALIKWRLSECTMNRVLVLNNYDVE